jgi:hypothetical protein
VPSGVREDVVLHEELRALPGVDAIRHILIVVIVDVLVPKRKVEPRKLMTF